MKFDQSFVRFLFLQIILAVFIAYLVTTGLKFLFVEPRPCELLDSCPDGFSFPSRHTGMAVAAATIFAVYMRKIPHGILALSLGVLVGYYRVAIGAHTTIDVIGGFFVGVGAGLLVYYLSKKFPYKKYHFVRKLWE